MRLMNNIVTGTTKLSALTLTSMRTNNVTWYWTVKMEGMKLVAITPLESTAKYTSGSFGCHLILYVMIPLSVLMVKMKQIAPIMTKKMLRATGALVVTPMAIRHMMKHLDASILNRCVATPHRAYAVITRISTTALILFTLV